jgi:hypothetical protein
MLVLLPADGLGEVGSEKIFDEVLAPKLPPLKELLKALGDPKEDVLWLMPLTLCDKGLPTGLGENCEIEPAKL